MGEVTSNAAPVRWYSTVEGGGGECRSPQRGSGTVARAGSAVVGRDRCESRGGGGD